MTENLQMWIRTLLNMFLTGANISLMIYMQFGYKKMYKSARSRASDAMTRYIQTRHLMTELIIENRKLRNEIDILNKNNAGDLPRLDI